MPNHSQYTASIHYDKRLYRHDIDGSLAHVRMLAKQDIVSQEDAALIADGLAKVRQEIEADIFPSNTFGGKSWSSFNLVLSP